MLSSKRKVRDQLRFTYATEMPPLVTVDKKRLVHHTATSSLSNMTLNAAAAAQRSNELGWGDGSN